jgi:SnoaL-like domain
MTPAVPDLARRVADLQRFIAEGRILQAMDEFYGPELVMQENQQPPCVGLAANRERERAFVAAVREWKGSRVLASAVAGDTSFVESELHFVLQDGTEVRQVQVSRARWRDGRIVDERFYHG